MSILFKNGTVINASGRQTADVSVCDGKIIKVAENITPDSGTKVIDCKNMLVLPGAIDAHTHFETTVLVGPDNVPYTSADDFFTGTRAAACGGVTTVIDFVTPARGQSLMEALNNRKKAAGSKACIDYSLHMGLTEQSDTVIEEMRDVVDAGVSSFKVFMTYAIRLSDEELLRVLTRSRELGAITMVHAEAHEELEQNRTDFITQGKTSPWYHYLSRPESVETKGAERAIKLAVVAGAPLYIVHLACSGGMKAVEKAQKDGHEIFAETCPQYLHFTSDVYKRTDAENFVCSPPVKDEKSREALWQGIKNGSIATVATDHCPFNLAEKALGKNNFTKIPNGVMGVENFYPYMLSAANEGRISYECAVKLCCSNPADIFKLSPNKGSITPGADADIVVYDPAKEFLISQKNMHSSVDYTIWEGVALKGYPVQTYSRGKLVYNNGDFTGGTGGRFYWGVQGDGSTVPFFHNRYSRTVPLYLPLYPPCTYF